MKIVLLLSNPFLFASYLNWRRSHSFELVFKVCLSEFRMKRIFYHIRSSDFSLGWQNWDFCSIFAIETFFRKITYDRFEVFVFIWSRLISTFSQILLQYADEISLEYNIASCSNDMFSSILFNLLDEFEISSKCNFHP